MPLYRYIKSIPKKFDDTGTATTAFYDARDRVGEIDGLINTARRVHSTIPSFVLMTIGAGILVWVLWPILSFSLFVEPLFAGVISPVGLVNDSMSKQSNYLSPVVLAAGGNVDTADANTWFPTQPQKKVVTPVNTYTLSIPKLNIQNATVAIAGDDLSKNLVHYGGTGLPGEYGTTVIFGHSVLPQFFDPHNYKTIFSTLPTIKPGDDIFVTYDSIQYQYHVVDLVVTEPNDLSSLEQNFSDSYLTLITCVPPGTFWKRLNVRAKLVRPVS